MPQITYTESVGTARLGEEQPLHGGLGERRYLRGPFKKSGL